MSQYHHYNPSQKCFLLSQDVVFDKSTSYYNSSDTVGQASTLDCKPVSTPMEPDKLRLKGGGDIPANRTPYLHVYQES